MMQASTIGAAMTALTELWAMGKQTPIQAATTRTPNHPLMAHACRSRITTRVPAWPTGVAWGAWYDWTDWVMNPS